MSEYISKDKVKEIIENRDSGFLACLKALDDIKNLDDLYIVRCKDCIHARQNETFPEKYECRFSSTLRKPDGFCDEGETEEDFK